MKCNDHGKNLIKHFEGCRLTAYADAGGVFTIGYGHTGHGVGQGLAITQEQAEAFFERDLAAVERSLNRIIEWELDNNQFSAMCAFAYNIGTGAFAKSAVLDALNVGDFDDVPAHMLAWVHCGAKVLKGLEARRAAEIILWEAPDDSPPPVLAV